MSNLVGEEGLEPSSLSATDFKSVVEKRKPFGHRPLVERCVRISRTPLSLVMAPSMKPWHKQRPFAPSPLQGLHDYYERIRHLTFLCQEREVSLGHSAGFSPVPSLITPAGQRSILPTHPTPTSVPIESFPLYAEGRYLPMPPRVRSLLQPGFSPLEPSDPRSPLDTSPRLLRF